MGPVETERCPLCHHEWRVPDDLRVAAGNVYWKGKLVTWGAGEYRGGGAATKIFLFLFQRAGKEQRISAIYSELFSDRTDGGPSANNFRVVISRIRRGIRRHNLPVRIDTIRGAHEGSQFGGFLVMHLLSP